MKSHIEKFSKLENSTAKVINAWRAGNDSLIKSMGENYYFLDQDYIGIALVTDDCAMEAIKSELKKTVKNIDDDFLNKLSKSVASGEYFKEVGLKTPNISKPESPNILQNQRMIEIKDVDAKYEPTRDEQLAKAKAIGRGNPIFSKLMPGSINGKFLGKTGKFAVEYPLNSNVSSILNSKIEDMSDFVDEELGNEDTNDKTQRIFVSKELKKENSAVCVVMYHGFNGEQNRDIAAAVKEAILDSVPANIRVDISKPYSVLSTELQSAQTCCSVSNNNLFMKTDLINNISKPENVKLDMSLAPSKQIYEDEQLTM